MPAAISPTLAFVAAWSSRSSWPTGWSGAGARERSRAASGSGRSLSSGLLSISHGTNDGQKTMGVITLALVAEGAIPASHVQVPTWVIIASATAMGLGTYAGGWRIIKTTGMRIIKMDPSQGFAAQSAGAAAILAASHYGFPISTTHVINGGVMGAGAAKRLSAVRWGVAGNIVAAWILTLPAAAVASAAAYALTWALGGGLTGPLVLFVLGVLGLVAIFGRRVRAQPVPVAQS